MSAEIIASQIPQLTWQHTSLSILRRSPYRKHHCDNNDDTCIRQEPRRHKQMSKVYDGRNTLFFGAIEREDGRADETLNAGDPAEQGQLFVEEEVR